MIHLIIQCLYADCVSEQMLWVHSELKARPAADKQSKQNIEAWLWNHPGAVIDRETEFINATDLINVVAVKKSPIRKFLERMEGFRSCGMFRSTVSCDCTFVPFCFPVLLTVFRYQLGRMILRLSDITAIGALICSPTSSYSVLA